MSTKKLIAIDPGNNGALVLLRSDFKILEAVDMPLFSKKQAGKIKNFVDYMAINDIFLRWHADGAEEIWIEDVHATPQMGVTSSFNFGKGAGMLYGAAGAYWHQNQINSVHASKWKPALGCTADKKQTISRAVIPQAGGVLLRGAHGAGNLKHILKPRYVSKPGPRKLSDFSEGRVEAALIGYWSLLSE